MKDIDFDELDKAVNSLMGTAPAPKEASIPASAPNAEPVAQVETPAEAAPVTPVESAVPVALAPASPPSRPAAVAPAQRRGGRFMDMVHASSDMKSRTSQAPSREGMTVMPRTQPEVAETPAVLTADDAVSSISAPDLAAEPKDQAWPDPLELAAGGQTDESKAAESTISSDVSEDAEGVPEAAPETPLETPFLSDAKVEKRPLNPGTPPLSQIDDAQAGVTEEPVVVTDTEETPRPFVPAELSSDLVAIESGELKGEVSGTPEKPVAATASASVEEKTLTGPSSIAQQYREQPSSGDQSHAAIYDASQFPAPLSHPAKKKSGWLWIVWVVLLLAVGAGGAVALYMTGIIS